MPQHVRILYKFHVFLFHLISPFSTCMMTRFTAFLLLSVLLYIRVFSVQAAIFFVCVSSIRLTQFLQIPEACENYQFPVHFIHCEYPKISYQHTLQVEVCNLDIWGGGPSRQGFSRIFLDFHKSKTFIFNGFSKLILSSVNLTLSDQKVHPLAPSYTRAWFQLSTHNKLEQLPHVVE